MGDSIWVNAQMSLTAVLGAINRANPGPPGSPNTPLDSDIVSTISKEADVLEGFPETQEWASRLKEIAFRYRTGRPAADQWKRDGELVHGYISEVLRHLKV